MPAEAPAELAAPIEEKDPAVIARAAKKAAAKKSAKAPAKGPRVKKTGIA
jgi:hypothetical protein